MAPKQPSRAVMPLPAGAEYACQYDISSDALLHYITLDGKTMVLHQFTWMTDDDLEREWRVAIRELQAPRQLRITGLVRAKLPPGYDILPHKRGEFYLRMQSANIDYALPFRDEAWCINSLCMTNITQGEFDGEYRGATAPVRSNPPQAPSPGAGRPAAQRAHITGRLAIATSPHAAERASVERLAPRIGELVAHRAWFWDSVQRRLTSLGYYPLRWEPEVPMQDTTVASLDRHHDLTMRSIREAGDECIKDDNQIGVWSFKSARGPIHEYCLAAGSGDYAKSTASQHKLALVIGTCWIWGTVVEHRKGYRSQFGAIRSLDQMYRLHYGQHWHPSEEDEPLLGELRTFYKLRPEHHAD